MSIEYVSSPNTDAWESELAELSAYVASATWRQLTLIRLIEPTGRWALDGATSYPAWLSWRIGLAPGAAREKIRVARALGRLPRIDEAFEKANLSFSKVRALTRVADASNEGTLLEWALHTTAAHLETICRGIRCVERDENGNVVEARPIERWARQRVVEDGSVRIEAQLLPDEAALVWRALEVARGIGAPDVPGVGEGVIDGASALVRIAESFLANGAQARPGDERTELVVHLENDRLRDDGEALEARLEDGAHVPAETLRRVSCDCSVRAVVVDGRGSPLDVGHRKRLVPPRLRRALSLRDRCCRFPGCAHRAWLDAHHIRHWLHGGPTDADNLVLLCPAHHRLVHEGGFTISADAGEITVRSPDGRLLPAHVMPSRAPGDVLDRLRVSAGTRFDDQTLLPDWDGKPPVVAACVEAGRRRSGSVRISGA